MTCFSSFSVAHSAVSDNFCLKPCDVICVDDYNSPSEYKVIASNPELMAGIEEHVHSWCKQIEQVYFGILSTFL